MQPRRLRRWLSISALACVLAIIAGFRLREWLLAESGAAQLLRTVAVACGEAIDAASPDVKRRFVKELSLIESSAPTLADAFELERAHTQLAVYARFTPAQAARLPVGCTLPAWGELFEFNTLERVALRLRWRRTVRSFDDLIAASALPAAARDAEFASIDRRQASVVDEWVGFGHASAGDWVRIAQVNDEAHALLAFLGRVARVDLGEEPWPPGGSLRFEGAPPLEVVLHRD